MQPEDYRLIRVVDSDALVPSAGTPALSEIINRSLVHIQTSKTSGRLHRVGQHELQWPDYQLVCFWAEQLNIPPAGVLVALFEPLQFNQKYETTLIDGRFISTILGPKLRGIKGLPSIEGLQIKIYVLWNLMQCLTLRYCGAMGIN